MNTMPDRISLSPAARQDSSMENIDTFAGMTRHENMTFVSRSFLISSRILAVGFFKLLLIKGIQRLSEAEGRFDSVA